MILKIKKYGDSVLKKKTERIEKITPEIKELIFNMKETISADRSALGLAAPQVGFSKRIFVIQGKDGPMEFINPEILKESRKKIILEEGCLSFPKIFLKIKRAKEIILKAENEEGESFEIKADGILARVFLHEVDHLNGILFIDRIGLINKIKIKNKLKNI